MEIIFKDGKFYTDNENIKKVMDSIIENDTLPLWLCIYQYKGMETEGNTFSEELFICKANDEAEALFKYKFWLSFNKGSINTHDKTSLDEYRKKEFADGGWGYIAYKLDDINEKYRNDHFYFQENYNKFYSL